ncbi:MAG: hypothetical protein GWN41_09865 [Phycisphaerae bacterium]|nr:hypothetical protein [candidate division KSB1 bacterium]NIV70408.1 hypothetical protein [Phycisphaerae bacterium]
MTNQTYPNVDPEEVVVYVTPNDVTGDYEKIGIIHAQGESSWTNEHQMIESAKKKAASIGANGIILGEIDEPSAGAKIAGAIFGTGTTRRTQILAIYVFENQRSGAIEKRAKEPDIRHVNQMVEREPESGLDKQTRLYFFREMVSEASKYSDEHILKMYRKKYPNLRQKSDDKIIELIEKHYKRKYEAKSQSLRKN